MDSLATAFNYNKTYLSRLILQLTGKSFIDIVTQMKLQAGCEFLKSTDFSLDQIAEVIGYNSYLLVGATICGGAAFAALEQFFRSYAVAAGAPDVPQFEVMKRLLEQQSGKTEAWTVKTTFLGTRENPNDTGAVSGIRIANFHPAALIQGTLNGMAKELYDLYCVLGEHAGISRSKLVASGNGIRRNEFLQNVLSDLFGMPVTVERNEEEAAFGAAVSALAVINAAPLEQWLC